MKGFLAFSIVTASVASLLAFPELWPIVVTGLVFVPLLTPRNRGGKLNGGQGS